MSTDLRNVVDAVEAAKAPNYELEHQIRNAVHPALERAPAYTASRDAAELLRPPGWELAEIRLDDVAGGFVVVLREVEPSSVTEVGPLVLITNHRSVEGRGATEALARTSAALRARLEDASNAP